MDVFYFDMDTFGRKFPDLPPCPGVGLLRLGYAFDKVFSEKPSARTAFAGRKSLVAIRGMRSAATVLAALFLFLCRSAEESTKYSFLDMVMGIVSRPRSTTQHF